LVNQSPWDHPAVLRAVALSTVPRIKGRAVPKVLFTFGREDELDRDAIRRLVASLSRLLEPGEALAANAVGAKNHVRAGQLTYGRCREADRSSDSGGLAR
jgi:hypothetical protein